MIVVGIDSATKAGFGVVERKGPRERLIEYGAFALPRQGTERAAAIEAMVSRLTARFVIDVAAIEDNYLAQGEQENVVTLKALARLCGRWEQAWEARGVATMLVLAQRWQVGLLAGLCGPRSDRKTRKAASAMWCRATFGVTPSEDASDAIGLATWVARQESFRARLAG